MAKQLSQLQTRSVLGSIVGVVLMSCKVNFHAVRSALQNSQCVYIQVAYKCVLAWRSNNRIQLNESGIPSNWNPESKFHWQTLRNPRRWIQNPESRIQECPSASIDKNSAHAVKWSAVMFEWRGRMANAERFNWNSTDSWFVVGFNNFGKNSQSQKMFNLQRESSRNVTCCTAVREDNQSLCLQAVDIYGKFAPLMIHGCFHLAGFGKRC